MSRYSTPAEISAFRAGLGARPMIVNDVDGNVARGYKLSPGRTLELGPEDDPDNQSIPFGTSQAELQELVDNGTVYVDLFASKAMDVRLAPELVAAVNENTRAGRPLDLAFLTSRGSEHVLTVFRESGVLAPERATLVADSGNRLYYKGEPSDIRSLSRDEQNFLLLISDMKQAITDAMKDEVSGLGLDAGSMPQPYIEQKGTATNVHWRAILDHYGQAEGSALDVRIGTVMKEGLTRYLEQRGPKEGDGSPVFKILAAPASTEVKLAGVNKGHGLEALIKKAMELPEDQRPTAVVFTGDDVCKEDGSPGTDYFAMIEADRLQEKYGIPVFNIHTHHPEGGINGVSPDPKKDSQNLAKAGYDVPRIDLVVPTPQRLVEFIVSVRNTPSAPLPQRRPSAGGGQAPLSPEM